MDTEDRINNLELAMPLVKEEMQQLLLDIRSFISEARSPLRAKPETGKANPKDETKKGMQRNGTN
jgi:hypothetical protein